MLMKALVFSGKGEPILQVRPKPAILKPTDAIVKMVKTTICGTDLHILKGDVATCENSRILGHEGIAVVEFAGEGHALALRRRGWKLGNTIDGTQAEYVRIPHADGSLHLMVEGATAEEQIMISDALPTGFECGVLSGQVSTGCTIAIVGCGPVGISAMVTSQLYSPSQVIMIGRNANRVALAKTMGATHGIVSGQGVDIVAAVKELTNGEDVDTVIEAVGVPATFELCQELVAPGRTIANLGVHGCKVDLHLENLWDKNITITTRLVDATTAPMLIKLLGSVKIKVAGLVTHRYNFADIEEAYDTFGAAAKHKAVKVILHF
ncbi:alcohol dehydrogenase GroES domain protein [Armillaria mellea]|nr:alcohol dehydrogenase GroES domain protein [Armillaria mellea]